MGGVPANQAGFASMISKPFSAASPNRDRDPRGHAGWEAERNVAFVLERAFGDPARRDVRVFNDLRFPATFVSGAVADGDFAQTTRAALSMSKAIERFSGSPDIAEWKKLEKRWAGRALEVIQTLSGLGQRVVDDENEVAKLRAVVSGT